MNKVACTMMASVMAFSLTASASLVDITSNYNVFVSENFTASNSDANGRIAAGGDVTINPYAVGLKSSKAEYSLISGGNVSLQYGQVYNGGIFANGNVSINDCTVFGNVDANGVISGGGTVMGTRNNNAGMASPLDFASVTNELSKISRQLFETTAEGTFKKDYSGITLTGTGNEGITVFNLDGSLLKNLNQLTIDIGEKEAAIINVTGKNLTVNGFGLRNGSNGAFNRFQDVLFNFYEADVINLNGSFGGSILAMDADVIGQYGAMDGGIFAESFDGHEQFHLYAFNHDIPSKEVPEAPMVSFLLTGLLGLVPVIRKNHKK